MTELLAPTAAPASRAAATTGSSHKRNKQFGKHHHHRHHKKHRRRTVKSHGGPVSAHLASLTVQAPKGAIHKGQTLTIQTAPKRYSAPGVPSMAGGPFRISTSQGEPSKPVTVTFTYNAGLLHHGDKPLVLHDSSIAHAWIPVGGRVNAKAHTVSVRLASFSLLDVVDDATYYAGMLTGNRLSLPDCSGGATPSWVDSVTLPDSNQDPLPICFSSPRDTNEAVLSMVNNRGFAQVITISGLKPNIRPSWFSDSLDGTAAAVFAGLDPANGPYTLVLGPGQSAKVGFPKPPSQPAAIDVHIDPATHAGSAVAEMGWALLNTAIDQIGAPVSMANCAWGVVYNNLRAVSASSLIGELKSCTSTAIKHIGSKASKQVLHDFAWGLLVDDFFYKVIDAEGDALYPPMIGFTIPGTNPTFTNPNIHVEGLNFGSLPTGQETVEHLSASGGTPPYTFHIWNEPENMAKVPSWLSLEPDGTVDINPPAGTEEAVSFYVYATDATGEHSPFARERIDFTIVGTGASNYLTPVVPPLPLGASANALVYGLNSVACPVGGTCIAVGILNEEGQPAQGLIESLSEGTWSAIRAPVPASAPPEAAIWLESVACPERGTCMAAGWLSGWTPDTHEQYVRPMTEQLSGGTWSASSLPLPPGAATNAHAELTSVRCATSSFCVAIGTYESHGLIETFSGGVWAALAAPVPANSDPSNYSRLESLACPGEGVCDIAGTYSTSDGQLLPFVDELSGGAWSPVALPVPTNAEGKSGVWAGDISCPVQQECESVGAYYDKEYSDLHALVETLSDGVWTGREASTPGGIGAGLSSVACPVVSYCVAVGSWADVTSETLGLLETWASGVWTPKSAPPPPEPEANGEFSLYFVRCRAQGSCVAAGDYSTNHGSSTVVIVETLVGESWDPALVHLPSDGGSYWVSAVGCPTSGACVIVGGSWDGGWIEMDNMGF